jgi:hypothetical protein
VIFRSGISLEQTQPNPHRTTRNASTPRGGALAPYRAGPPNTPDTLFEASELTFLSVQPIPSQIDEFRTSLFNTHASRKVLLDEAKAGSTLRQG